MASGVRVALILLCLLSATLYASTIHNVRGNAKRDNAKPTRIAIIGAGVIGLSTASALIQMKKENPHLPPLTIDVFANLDWDDTLSKGIAGLFRIDQGTHINRVYGNQTFDRLANLFRTVGGFAGVQLVSGHIISNNISSLNNQSKFYGDIVYNFRFLTPREIRQQFLLDDYNVDAIHYTAYTSEGLKYCPYMRELLEDEGVRFHKRHIHNVDELGAEGYDVVINCAGLYGAQVANDGDIDNVYPVRGILLKVDAPWQKHFLYRDYHIFTIPVIDGVYVGTVKEFNKTDTTATMAELKHIFDQYVDVQPAMANVAIVGTFVGLRPGRKQALTDNVRVESLEKPVLHTKYRKYKVVHNYGHGGNGFTLGWGTSLRAAKLALGLNTDEYDEADELDAVVEKYHG